MYTHTSNFRTMTNHQLHVLATNFIIGGMTEEAANNVEVVRQKQPNTTIHTFLVIIS